MLQIDIYVDLPVLSVFKSLEYKNIGVLLWYSGFLETMIKKLK